MVQGGSDGRDHHPNAFTMWLAGGGIKPGVTIGSSDEFGFNVASGKVHVHDLQATLLHLLGFDHTRLTYRFQGRDFRLTECARTKSSRRCWLRPRVAVQWPAAVRLPAINPRRDDIMSDSLQRRDFLKLGGALAAAAVARPA